MTVIGQSQDDVHHAGETAGGAGSFVCQGCSFPVSFEPAQSIPECPNCGGTDFRRASMFEQPTVKAIALTRPSAKPTDWLDGVRDSISAPGKYLAMFADGRSRVIELSDGWSRIGRSRSADIRLDDPTVSRRHAVIVKTPEGELRVLDDRSMNGIWVNGESVDWSPLSDGDELQIGRYTLVVIESVGR
ncbi:MAG TPA: FHA domain-containing protein [Solirubrobacterales bacterium]|nr:FHA domain-containing protein [Solirubrobacterales bacterium]